jgi:hypothetical protein
MFMRHNYILAPHTIYRGVHKLEPGTNLTLPRVRKKAMIPVRRIRSNSSLCGDSHGTAVRVKRLTRMYNSTPPPHPVLGRSD